MGGPQGGGTEVSGSSYVLACSHSVSNSQQPVGKLGVNVGQGGVVRPKMALSGCKGLTHNLAATNPVPTQEDTGWWWFGGGGEGGVRASVCTCVRVCV